MNNYRDNAIDSLKKIFKDNSYTNLVINSNMKNIEKKYFSIYRKSVLGTVENLIFIDWVINKVSKTKVKKMEIEVASTLRLGVYQLFFLDNTYENVTVNESVQYIKENVNQKTSKFVNAVLRNIIRSKENIYEDMNSLPLKERMSIKYSYPFWLVEKWIKQFGKENIEEVLIKNNQQAPLEARVNITKITREELIIKLKERNINAKKCKFAKFGIVIENPHEIESMEEYKNGLFSIQSESSMIISQILNPKENSFVLDVCAAPGGKTLSVAEYMNNTGKIISRDIYDHKILLIEKELKRLDITNVKTEKSDAKELDFKLVETLDYCIVDVPCSGLGIIRRKPDIKYNKTEKEMKNFSSIQYDILENSSKYLKVGGELVYSTCTVNDEENIDIVQKFLKNNKNFSLVDISSEVENLAKTSTKGYINIYPHIHNMDGFFIAKLKKCDIII